MVCSMRVWRTVSPKDYRFPCRRCGKGWRICPLSSRGSSNGRTRGRNGRCPGTLRPETRAKLAAYQWPGNIRELESTVARAVATTTSNVLLPEDITFAAVGRHVARSGSGTAHDPAAAYGAMAPAVDALVERLERLPIGERYDFLKSQGGRTAAGRAGRVRPQAARESWKTHTTQDSCGKTGSVGGPGTRPEQDQAVRPRLRYQTDPTRCQSMTRRDTAKDAS